MVTFSKYVIHAQKCIHRRNAASCFTCNHNFHVYVLVLVCWLKFDHTKWSSGWKINCCKKPQNATGKFTLDAHDVTHSDNRPVAMTTTTLRYVGCLILLRSLHVLLKVTSFLYPAFICHLTPYTPFSPAVPARRRSCREVMFSVVSVCSGGGSRTPPLCRDPAPGLGLTPAQTCSKFFTMKHGLLESGRVGIQL